MGYTTDGLTFNTLRDANAARIPTFRNSRGELCHNADGSDWSLNDWLTATMGELGELANVLKKVRRGDFTLGALRPEIAKELADVQIYLDILAFRCGVDLGRATIDKFNEVSNRVKSPVFIRDDGGDYELKDMRGARCDACGEPMPEGEEMFKFHGYSGLCPLNPPR